MRYVIFLCLYLGLAIGNCWGVTSPTVCNFADPAFETLSHQKVSFEIPKDFRVGQENFVIITLEKPDLPSGYMIRVATETIQSPPIRPEIQGWYPKSMIKPLEQGDYEIKIDVHLIYKGS